MAQPNTIQPSVEADFTFALTEPFALERGGHLQPVTLRYSIYGDLEKHRDRVILACHALSGSSRVADWWPELFGPDHPFDTTQFCVLGVNILGSCYGSTGPTSFNPATKRRYGPEFPIVTIADIVRSQALLLDHLGIERLQAAVGGSIGGMQALEWAVQFPERVRHVVAVGAAPLNAMGLALNHLQRQAIWNDPAFKNGWYEEQPANGLGQARALAMLSYKSPELFSQRYGRRPNRNGEDPFATLSGRFDIAGYLDYQQKIFLERFDANSYVAITKLMDSWHLPEKESQQFRAMAGNKVRVELVGISSDWLFPVADVEAVHQQFVRAGILSHYSELVSDHGHDAFLADADRLFPLFHSALHETQKAAAKAAVGWIHAGAAD